MALLEIEDLQIRYRQQDGAVRAVDGVSLVMERGDTLGLVGESGCGKTSVAKSILRLLPRNGLIAGGKIVFDGVNLISADNQQMRNIRWNKISLIPQNALNALDPVYRVGDQIFEVIKLHRSMTRADALERIGELFDLVDIDRKRMESYPHELSGGMKQRVFIAMALTLGPDLIIADEPTTALDVIVKDRVLEGITQVQEKFQVAMLYISHDLSIIAETCSKTAVMYGGKIVERGSTEQIFVEPLHPYTMGLINAFPNLHSDTSLVSIPGSPPNLVDPPKGCRFLERCPFSIDGCRAEAPPLVDAGAGHFSACYRNSESYSLRGLAAEENTWVRGVG